MVTAPSPLLYRSARGRWVVAATVLGSAMAGIDATVVGIALPTIGRSFHAGVSELQWVTNAYTLTLAGLLLLGGSLGDRYGRRRVFEIGTAWFALASLLCAIAPDAPALIGARALQGVGAALLTPGSLAILQASFVREDRSRAIGAWAGLGGVATAVGPFLGGWFISAVSWRLIFFINLPVAVAVLAVSRRHVPESKDPTMTGRLDIPGAALFSLALAGLTYGLTEGASFGWGSPVIVGSLLAGAALLVAFCVVELAQKSPLLPLGIFRSAQFSGANAVTFVVYAGLGGALFLLPIQLQTVLGFSPLEAGISLLPITVIMLALVSSVGGAGGPHRASPTNVGRPVIRGRRAGVVGSGGRNEQICAWSPPGFGRAWVRPGRHRGPAHRRSTGGRAERALGCRISGQQRCGPGRLPGGRGRPAQPGRHYGQELPSSGGVLGRFPQRRLDRRRRLCSGFSHRRPHHPQPCASAKTGGAKTRVGSRMAMRARRPGAVPSGGS